MNGSLKIDKLLLLLLFLLLHPTTETEAQRINVDSMMLLIQKHVNNQLATLRPSGKYPRTYRSDGSLKVVKPSDWTSGFFPGILWLLFDYTQDTYWLKQAERWTVGLEFEKYNTRTHDVGFILTHSFGHGYRLTSRPHYRDVLLEGAASLASRYNTRVRSIRSWEHGDWKFPVIVDNMMNLELLFIATKISGQKKFAEIAVSHANTTLNNHYRSNGSAYHVVDYDPETGEVISRTNAQGYTDESSWARGQAWGLYGFVMVYRETRNRAYLEHAEKLANYFIQNLPKNRIPYWDFNAPNIPFELQDASAAAIAAAALLELSGYAEETGNTYFSAATSILRSLCSPSFFAPPGSNGNFLLMHGVGSTPSNREMNSPLIFSDYYLVEALVKYYLIINK
jgi:unsaturated chondroitin disaccharide hydrolase